MSFRCRKFNELELKESHLKFDGGWEDCDSQGSITAGNEKK